jgi:hypothetical protein
MLSKIIFCCFSATCNCEKCILVERRRVLNTQLHELEEQDEKPLEQTISAEPVYKAGSIYSSLKYLLLIVLFV